MSPQSRKEAEPRAQKLQSLLGSSAHRDLRLGAGPRSHETGTDTLAEALDFCTPLEWP